MNLYLLTQDQRIGYDTYDSVVVAAMNEDEARNITPNACFDAAPWSSWCSSPDKVSVTLIGTAIDGTLPGVILASFNAG